MAPPHTCVPDWATTSRQFIGKPFATGRSGFAPPQHRALRSQHRRKNTRLPLGLGLLAATTPAVTARQRLDTALFSATMYR